MYLLPGFSVTAPWAFNWFLDGNENKVDISIVGTNGKFFPSKRPWGAPTDGRCYGNSRYLLTLLSILVHKHESEIIHEQLISHNNGPVNITS